MMEDQVVALLRADAGVAALVGSRIHPISAPQGTPSPFVTYQVADVDRSGVTYEGKSTFDNTLLQVDCWSDEATSAQSRYDQVTALARAVKAALDDAVLTGEDEATITWQSWQDLGSVTEARRSLDFEVGVRDP